jgi:hypothetical protein
MSSSRHLFEGAHCPLEGIDAEEASLAAVFGKKSTMAD